MGLFDEHRGTAVSRPAFATLREHFPRRELIDTAALYAELGWDDLVHKEAFRNTCATRVSLALVKSGMAVPGRMTILKGPFKGSRIEPGHEKLSLLLQRRSMLGAPEKFRMGLAEKAIGVRSGIVSFWQLYPDVGRAIGHIDLVYPGVEGALACGNQCYWDAREVWFWPLV